jgi:hypothetical protein
MKKIISMLAAVFMIANYAMATDNNVPVTANTNVQIDCDNDAGTNPGTNYIFFTHYNGATELMRIQEDGKVGIGTPSPANLLDVTLPSGSSSQDKGIVINGGNGGYLKFNNLVSTTDRYLPYIRGKSSYTSSGFPGLLIEGLPQSDNTSNAAVHIRAVDPDDGNTATEYSPVLKITNWASTLVLVDKDGNVGIGTTTTSSYKLSVNGSIRAKEVKVETGWSDFVFKDGYNLRPLEDVEKFINKNKHLPDIPNEKEIARDGVALGEMQAKLLQKVEELTLYVIELRKKVTALEQENQMLQKR